MATTDNSYIATGVDMVSIADKIREKAGVSDGLIFPDGWIEAIEGIETGGGSSWTDSYSVFATGTFIPTENSKEWSIDTGVPFDCAGGTNYLRQTLMIWREPDETTISGFFVCAKRASATKVTNNSGSYFSGGALGFAGGTTQGMMFRADSNPFPEEGETIWTISDLNTSTNFRAGKSYRWILLGALNEIL